MDTKENIGGGPRWQQFFSIIADESRDCSNKQPINAPIVVMPHLPQVGPGRGFCRGFVSRFVPRVGDLYHVFWYCVCNFCAYEHHSTKNPIDPLSTIGDFESESCP